MEFLKYTLLRLVLLVATIGLFHALGMRGFLLIVVGFIASGVVSYFALSSQRAALGRRLGAVFGRINDRIDKSSRAEDEDPADAGDPAGTGPRPAGHTPE